TDPVRPALANVHTHTSHQKAGPAPPRANGRGARQQRKSSITQLLGKRVRPQPVLPAAGRLQNAREVPSPWTQLTGSRSTPERGQGPARSPGRRVGRSGLTRENPNYRAPASGVRGASSCVACQAKVLRGETMQGASVVGGTCQKVVELLGLVIACDRVLSSRR